MIDLTLLGVHTHHDDDLVTTDTNELLHGTDSPARKLGKQDHALDTVVLKL